MKDDSPIMPIIFGVVRYLLVMLLSGLITRKYVTEGQVLTATPYVAGILLVVASMVARKVKTWYQIRAAHRMSHTATIEEVKQQAKKDNPLPDLIS